MDNLAFNPVEGFLNTDSYPDPASGTAARTQLQSLHTQTRDFINDQIVTTINSINSAITAIQNNQGTDENNITTLQSAVTTLQNTLNGYSTTFTTSGLKLISGGVTYDISVDGGGNVIATPEV